MTKYNNYAGVGSGDGVNRLAILDPHASQSRPDLGRCTVMKEVLTIAGPTLEPGSATAVKEWCINTAAVDPADEIGPRQQRGRLSLSLETSQQHADAADPADQRHRRVVHADGDRRRRRGLRGQQRRAVRDREVGAGDP